MENVIPINEERLVEIFSSKNFIGKVRSSSRPSYYEKAFSVYHLIFDPFYFIIRVITGVDHFVDVPELPENIEKYNIFNYLLISVHYHNHNVVPSVIDIDRSKEDVRRGDLLVLSKIRKKYRNGSGFDIKPIMLIGESTKNKEVLFLLVQEKSKKPLPSLNLRSDISILLEEFNSDFSANANELAAERLESSGLFNAKLIRIDTIAGPVASDLEKIALFAFEPQIIDTRYFRTKFV